MVELVDTPDLGSGALRCGGSSPLVRTIYLIVNFIFIYYYKNADVVELVDTPDLGSGASRCGGSSPLVRTINVAE